MSQCKCPIDGCDFQFSYGILGWDSHITRVENHPNYHPRVVVAEHRKRAFQRDFPEFFDLAKTALRRSSRPPAHKSGVMAKVELPITAPPVKKSARR